MCARATLRLRKLQFSIQTQSCVRATICDYFTDTMRYILPTTLLFLTKNMQVTFRNENVRAAVGF